MNYTIYGYQNGKNKRTYETDAVSHKKAVEQFIEEIEYFSHMKVVGKSTKRFIFVNKKIREVKSKVKIFKVDHDGHPALLLLIGNLPEFKHYANISERNKVFEEMLCPTQSTEYKPVESAENEVEQTDTTVLSKETLGSKSGSTLTKISNGYVMNATCKDLPTRLNTVKSSGKDKSKGLEESAWSYGYSPSHSRQKQTLFAKINVQRRDMGLYPTASETMKSMNGQVIKVQEFHVGVSLVVYKDLNEGYYWNEKWLTFRDIDLKVVSDISATQIMKTNIGSEFKAVIELNQGLHTFSLCNCGCGLYISKEGSYVSPSLLDLPIEPKKQRYVEEDWSLKNPIFLKPIITTEAT